MKKLLGLVAGLVLATSASAQINVGANFLIGMPAGDWHKAGDESFISTAFGGGIEGNYFVMDNLSVGLEIGFNSFGQKDESGFSVSATPIVVKGEYYFLDGDLRPFAGLGLGYYLVKMKFDGFPPLIPESDESVNGFGISPRVGATYQVSDMVALVLNLNYNILMGQKVDGESVDDATNWMGIGIGARFTIAD